MPATPIVTTPMPPRLRSEMKRLETFYNPTMEGANIAKEKHVSWKETISEYGPMALIGCMPAGTVDPKNVKEAKESNAWEKWWEV